DLVAVRFVALRATTWLLPLSLGWPYDRPASGGSQDGHIFVSSEHTFATMSPNGTAASSPHNAGTTPRLFFAATDVGVGSAGISIGDPLVGGSITPFVLASPQRLNENAGDRADLTRTRLVYLGRLLHNPCQSSNQATPEPDQDPCLKFLTADTPESGAPLDEVLRQPSENTDEIQSRLKEVAPPEGYISSRLISRDNDGNMYDSMIESEAQGRKPWVENPVNAWRASKESGQDFDASRKIFREVLAPVLVKRGLRPDMEKSRREHLPAPRGYTLTQKPSTHFLTGLRGIYDVYWVLLGQDAPPGHREGDKDDDDMFASHL
ncbi:hypothetical protein GGR53DRAFT_530183, partial [Hypoxylon sp. FL1150]